MSYNGHGQPPAMSATFVPGGYDDFYIPAPGPELVSPAPQRHMPEMPDQIQENLAHLELGADGPKRSSYQSPPQAAQTFNHPPSMQAGQQEPVTVPPHTTGTNSYTTMGSYEDIPHFSPFPKLTNRPPNVPPSDEEKEGILESARAPVLNSNDPEMQLAWAQDALAFVAAAQTHEERLAESRPARPATPAVEHQLRVDATNIVSFLAQQHHPKAEFMKGMWLEFGNFNWRQDKREAFRCYARASEKGFYRADYRMGMQFEQNNDPIKALVHYQKGAANGDAASNYRLGMMTLMGQMGQAQDYAKGVQMLRIAAEHADENAPQGAYVFGMLQARELPQVQVPEVLLPYNLQEARANIEKAAYLGFPKAQVKMGQAYELCSLGCEFNPGLSLHYNALAARQGASEAEMAISKWFLCGHEGLFAKNDELAYEYAQRAAQSGLATAEFAMGYFNEIGVHVPVSIEQAKVWYERAAKAGNQDAVERVKSLNNQQQLNRKDHENVAINKIKSQYGSMRGKRPDRLRAEAPALPSVPDEAEEYSASGQVVPPRGSSITPYPMNDGPPQISAPAVRPPTVAPYPLDNGPPMAGGPSGFAGGFAPELRSHSAAPGQFRQPSGPAFGINPNLYDQGPPKPRPYSQAYPGNQPYQGQGRPLPRPATTLAAGDVGGGGYGARPANDRTSSGPPAMGGYGGPAGGQRLSPNRTGQAQQKPDIGYAAPAKNPSPSVSPNHRPQPSAQDIGYVAPLAPKKQSLMDQQPGPGGAYRPPRVDSRAPQGAQGRPQTGAPVGARPARQDALPGSQQTPPKKPAPSTATAPAQAGRPAVAKPTPAKPAPAKPPGKGPKTFDEMGVPTQQDKGECVVM